MFKSGKEVLSAKINNRINISLRNISSYKDHHYSSNSYGEQMEMVLEKKISQMIEYVLEEVFAELINDIYSHEEFEQDLGLNE